MLKKILTAGLVFAVFLNSMSVAFALDRTVVQRPPALDSEITVDSSTAKSIAPPLDVSPITTSPETTPSLPENLPDTIQTTPQLKELIPPVTPTLPEQNPDAKNTLDNNVPTTDIPPTNKVQVDAVLKNTEDRKPAGSNIKLQSDDATGALSMQYPFKVPPGRNGLQPDLAINYNSQNRDDGNIFGYGWSINIPYIERVNKKGTDKLYSENFFSSSIDGELSTITLTDGTHGIYGAKIENGDFLKYEYKSSGTWEVSDKKGLIYKFGLAVDSRQDNPANSAEIYKWMLTEIRDSNDNYIKYEYLKENGQIYPLRIKYTGNGSNDGVLRIEFSRTDRWDKNISYKTGFKVKTDYVISNITESYNDSSSLSYNFDYSIGDNGNRFKLNYIKEYGSQVFPSWQSYVLPPDSFQYQAHDGNWAYQSGYSIPVNLWNGSSGELSGAQVFDVNGDALPDIVFARKGDPTAVYINSADGKGWGLDLKYSMPVYFADKGGYDLGVRVADVNGDGLPDLIRASYEFNAQEKKFYIFREVHINKNDGTGWALDPNYVIPGPIIFIGNNDNRFRIADANGDGLPDFISSNSASDINGVYLNKGDGTGWTLSSTFYVPIKFDEPGSALADVNGDGLVDAIFSREGFPQAVFLNNGKTWEKDLSYTVPVYFSLANGGDNGVRMDDVNGDGLTDLLYAREDDFTNRKVFINKGNGTGWQADSSYDIPKPFIVKSGKEDNGVRMADVDGDGITDFLYRNDSALKGASDPIDINNRVYLGKSNIPDLLKAFYNQKGGHSQIDYKSSATYKDSLGKLLNPKLPFVLPLVSNVSTYDGISDPSSTKYEYSGGEYYYLNVLTRKFSGFNKITKKDDFGYTTNNYYHQGNSSNTASGEYNDSQAKIGMTYATEQYDENNNLYLKTFDRFDDVSLSVDRNFVQLIQNVDVAYDGSPPGKTTAEKYSYDIANGNLIKQVSMGEIQSDSQGNVTGDIGNDQFTTDITYTKDTVKNISLPAVETTTDQSGAMIRQTQNFYDGLPSLSAAKGNLTKQSFLISDSKYSSITKTYNNYGLVTQETDPLGNATAYTYDSLNIYPTKITNALGQSTSYTYDYSSGQVKQYTDPNGKKFETVYDIFDRPIEKKQPDPNNPSNSVTAVTYSYDDKSFPRSVSQSNKLNSAGDGPRTYTYFDGLSRIIQSRSELEDNVFSVKDYKYNKLGLQEKESLPYLSNGTSKTAPSTNGNLYISYTYDSLGRVKSIQNSVGTLVYTYDKWKMTVKDAENNSKDLFKDAYGNLIKVIEYNEGTNYKTEYQYDGLGKLLKVTDALGNVQNFTYDGLGRRTIVQDLHSPSDSTFGSHSYSYDDAGNLTNETDQNGQTINYSYDKANRLIAEDYIGQPGIETTYSYDNCSNGITKLCSVTSANVTTGYDYNPLGNIFTEYRTINGNKYNTVFNYDWRGNVLTVLYPDSTLVTYGYSKVGKIKTVKTPKSDIVKNISYIATGAIDKIENANGTIEKNTFDADKLYRLNSKTTSVGTNQIQGFSYTYDKAGNILQIVDSSNPTLSKTVNYQYDNLYRLKSAVSLNAGNGENYDQKFQYDALGNIISKSGQGAYSYAGNVGNSYAIPHAVTSVGTTNFNYDKNGNLLSDGKNTYKWDYKNRLIESSTAGVVTKYIYDHTGDRVQKSDGKNTVTYVNKFYEIRQDATVKHFYVGDDNVASIEVGKVSVPSPNNEIVYEDAEDGKTSGWVAYSPTTSTISSTDEDKNHGKVITVKDTRNYGGFKLLKDDGTTWEDTTHKFFNFDFSSKDNIQIALIVDTNQGSKYLEYNSIVEKSMAKDNYIYIKIDQSMLDGNWHTLTRDLQADINSMTSGMTLNKINYLQIWWMGSGYNNNINVDNIKLMNSLDPTKAPAPQSVDINKTIYHHSDHLSGGNIDTDETGTVIEMTDYYPFGEVRVDQATTAYKNPYKFTGKELDTNNGLYYYEARYYNPAIGRFVSEDPVEGSLDDPQSLNKYSYVRNNPVRYVDPTGKTLEERAWGALYGIWDSGVSTADAIIHPIDTANAIGEQFIQNVEYLSNYYENNSVSQFASDLVEGVGIKVDEFNQMSEYDKGYTIGGFTEKMMETAVTGKAIGKVVGKSGGGVNSKIYNNLEKQLKNNGTKSIFKSLKSAEKTLVQHIEKLGSAKYKSAIQKTIKNVSTQIKTIKKFIKKKNL